MNDNLIYSIPSNDLNRDMPQLMGPLSMGVEGVLVVDPLTGAVDTRY